MNKKNCSQYIDTLIIRIGNLEDRVGNLEDELWKIKNPAKYAVRDRVRTYEHEDGMIVRVDFIKKGNFPDWKYVILLDNRDVIVTETEHSLSAIKEV